MNTREASQTLVVLTTLADAAGARALVRALVESRLAACGTVIPGAVSTYWWDGAVAEEAEVLVLLKTRRERWAALRDALVSAHPYDVPEVLALPVTAGHEPYLDWIARQTEEDAA